MPRSALFTPLRLREVTIRNRIVISPMCQYAAVDGRVNDWHRIHLGKFAQGGAGAVFAEATAVESTGRITHGDLGIWSDEHVAGLRDIASFISGQGAVPGIQISHAGRKASAQRPWDGNGPLDARDLGERSEAAWETVAPSPLPTDEGWPVPEELDGARLSALKDRFRTAAERALRSGFRLLEVHCAHGYLLHQFLSPLTNLRRDEYGGDAARRMRFPLEVIAAVREVWPMDLPLFVRVSAIDGLDGGLTVDDAVRFARCARELDVDVIDCSAGGLIRPAMAGSSMTPAPGYQVPYAERVRREGGIASMAVGLIHLPRQADEIIAAGRADLVAIARAALDDPNWPLHAARALGEEGYDSIAVNYGFFLRKWDAILAGVKRESPHALSGARGA